MENKKPEIKRYSLFPKSIAKAMEPMLKPIYKQHGFAEHRLLTQWNTIVGDELAACSVPQKLSPARKADGGTLHILVATGRALELQHMEPVIMERIAIFFGYNAVTKIKLTQSSANIFRKARPVKTPETPPVSEKLKELVSGCDDEELRKALLSMGSLITNLY